MSDLRLASFVVMFLNFVLTAAYILVVLRDGRRRLRRSAERYGSDLPDTFYKTVATIQESKGRRFLLVSLTIMILSALLLIALTTRVWGVIHFLGIAILSFLLLIVSAAAARSDAKMMVTEMGLMSTSAVHGTQLLRWDDVRYIVFDKESNSFVVSDGIPEEDADPDADYVECNEFSVPPAIEGSVEFLKMALKRVERRKWRNSSSFEKARALVESSETKPLG